MRTGQAPSVVVLGGTGPEARRAAPARRRPDLLPGERRIALFLVMVVTFAILLPSARPAFAHEVLHEVRQARATVITLTFADGQPFGGEAFEAAPIGGGQAVVSGHTDARGRAVVLAEVPGAWRLRAWSDDGHGVDLRFEVVAPLPADPALATTAIAATAGPAGPAATGGTAGTPATGSDPAVAPGAATVLPRWLLMLVGLAIIALTFALLRRLIRRPDPAGARRPN